jgi:hypothetical protein
VATPVSVNRPSWSVVVVLYKSFRQRRSGVGTISGEYGWGMMRQASSRARLSGAAAFSAGASSLGAEPRLNTLPVSVRMG